jgi:peptide-methionine (S)-S-oxide reductase
MNVSRTNIAVLALAGVLALQLLPARAAEATRAVPPPTIDAPLAAKPGTATAVLAGGCFWGVEGVYEHVKGVQSVQSGYAGGSATTAHYEIVGSGLTGHAESVAIRYDPSKISYGKLLQVYFSVAHNPTELNRQGPDSGSQYRSTVFARDPEQARIATAYVAQLNAAHAFPAKVVTTIETGKTFYPAEGYHQNYLRLNPDAPYIVVNDLPKIAALKATFPTLYRADPAG